LPAFCPIIGSINLFGDMTYEGAHAAEKVKDRKTTEIHAEKLRACGGQVGQ
jgi:hypothetical protein